jgi:hypothetical protein
MLPSSGMALQARETAHERSKRLIPIGVSIGDLIAIACGIGR